VDIIKLFKENFNLENIKGQVTSARKTMQIIEALFSLLQDNKISASAREMINNLKTLIIDQPNIVTINHYINHFLLKLNPENQPIVLKELLEVFHERWKNVDRKTAEILFNHYELENKTILFFGAEKTMESIADICNVNQKKIKIVQVLARNDSAAKEQVKNLLEKDLPVQVVDLYNTGRLKDRINLVVLTAEIIMHETFITKSGGQLLALWAKQLDIPVIVIADSRKILNKKILPTKVLDSFINENQRSATEIWADAPEGLQVINYYLEEMPNELIHHFVLEQEAYSPAELSHEVDKILVSKFV
jgi:translation initiation factor 2B subunit (eIF-2B alpha/beta/delta family)